MLKVGTHVRTLLATAVIGTLGGNAALLLQPTSVSARPAPPTTTSTSTSTTAPEIEDVTDLPPLVQAPDLDAAAIAAGEAAGGVPVSSTRRCAVDSVQVSFDPPGGGWKAGAHVTPIGPTPTDTTTEVNGILLCAGSHYGYLGFMAALADGAWRVEIVPDAGDHDDDESPAKNKPDTAPRPKPAPAAPNTPIVGLLDGPDIEGYARYEGQSTCDPTPKPGTLALRNLLLSRYPATKSLGISRGCDVGGKSEHKEGRAFDWGANVGNGAQRAAVDDFLRTLFATDSHGHQHALVRRMGVMYVIWNQQIWSAYRADAGWQPYSGTSPHTDHVHISLSWAGARAQTSYYSGTVVAGLPDTPLSGGSKRTGSTPRVRTPRPTVPSTTVVPRAERRRRQAPPTSSTTVVPPRSGERRSGRDGGGDRTRDGQPWRQWPGPSTTTTTAPPPSTTTSTTTAAPPG